MTQRMGCLEWGRMGGCRSCLSLHTQKDPSSHSHPQPCPEPGRTWPGLLGTPGPLPGPLQNWNTSGLGGML